MAWPSFKDFVTIMGPILKDFFFFVGETLTYEYPWAWEEQVKLIFGLLYRKSFTKIL